MNYKFVQVMSAQDAAEAGTGNAVTGGDLEARTSGSALPNGVPEASSGTIFPGRDGTLPLENPNVYDPAPGRVVQEAIPGIPSGGVFLGQVEPTYEPQPHSNTDAVTPEVRTQGLNTPARRDQRRTSTPTSSTVRVQEFYSAEEGHGPDGREPGGVRWMTRFTEFLRTTASRGAHSMDRVLDNLGLTNPPPGPQDGRMLRAVTSPVRFSPPEELPQPRETSGPPVPTSWASTMPQPPLFGPNQVAQMRQAQRDFPQISATRQLRKVTVIDLDCKQRCKGS